MAALRIRSTNPVFYDGISLSCANLPSNLACTFDPGRILADGFAVLTIGPKAAAAAAQASGVAGIGRRGGTLAPGQSERSAAWARLSLSLLPFGAVFVWRRRRMGWR